MFLYTYRSVQNLCNSPEFQQKIKHENGLGSVTHCDYIKLWILKSEVEIRNPTPTRTKKGTRKRRDHKLRGATTLREILLYLCFNLMLIKLYLVESQVKFS